MWGWSDDVWMAILITATAIGLALLITTIYAPGWL